MAVSSGKNGQRRCNGGIAGGKVLVFAGTKVNAAGGLEGDGAVAVQFM